jgi:hypothetical protein
MAVEESLPSRHEENFESHDRKGRAEGTVRASQMRLTETAGPQETSSSRGHRLASQMRGEGAWRRAVILSEVLGTPLGLRKQEQQPGMQ